MRLKTSRSLARLFLGLLLLAGCFTPTDALRDAAGEAIHRGAAFLASAQNPDGGFGMAPGEASGYHATVWSLWALGAAGQGGTVRTSAAFDYVAATVPRFGPGADGVDSTANNLSLAILAAVAHRRDPRHLEGIDLVARLREEQDPATGHVGTLWNEHLFGMHALAAAHEANGLEAAAGLLEAAVREEGFAVLGRDRWYAAEAVVALAEAGRTVLALEGAAALAEELDGRGGLAPWEGAHPDASTTAAALRAFDAADGTDAALTAGAFLLRQLDAQDGHARFREGVEFMPVKTTAEVILALRGL